MYHILLLDTDSRIHDILQRKFSNRQETVAVTMVTSLEQARLYATNVMVDFFILYLDMQKQENYQFALQMRSMGRYQYTPMAICSYYMDFIISAIQRLHAFSYILKPCKNEEIDRIAGYISLLEQKQTFSAVSYLEINTKNQFHKIPLDEIFFIESRDRKSAAHTCTGEIQIACPIKKLLAQVPPNMLVQSHRSFLINPSLIRSIDKSAEPWVAYFDSYDKQAFISRNYKKVVDNTLHGLF